MEFEEKEFADFIDLFAGDFINLLPDQIAVYTINENYYQLPDKKETLSLMQASIKNKINLLLELPLYTFSDEDII